MKKSLLSLAALAITGSLAAQSNQLSFGADVALPMGDFGDAYSLGVGPAVGFELPIGDNLGVTAQVAYDLLFVKSELSDLIDKASMIPLQAGLKYYFMDSQEGFYGHAQLGVHMASTTTADQSFTILGQTTTIAGETNSSTNFSWAIGAGYQLEKFDIGVRYNSISPDSDAPDGTNSSTYIGLRIAYLLNLGN